MCPEEYQLTLVASQLSGTKTRILQMVDRLICHLDSRSPRIGSRDIRLSIGSRRSSYCGMVLADRLLHGHVHRQFRFRVSFGISHGWWDVLCHQTCRSARSGSDLRMGSRLVQPPRTDGGRLECGVYSQSDVAGVCQYELRSG